MSKTFEHIIAENLCFGDQRQNLSAKKSPTANKWLNIIHFLQKEKSIQQTDGKETLLNKQLFSLKRLKVFALGCVCVCVWMCVREREIGSISHEVDLQKIMLDFSR